MVIEEIKKTYDNFRKSYEFLLREYSSVIFDITEKLYMEHPKSIKGLILLDGCNVNFTSTQLTQLFLRNGICCVLIACLYPEEREKAIHFTGDMQKCTKFENYSVLRYFRNFFTWLRRNMRNDKNKKKQTNVDKIIICNFTQYRRVKEFLESRFSDFYIVNDLAHLHRVCND